MNGSPFRSFDPSSQLYVTPSRKTTPHHCNADRKVMHNYCLPQADMNGLSRNLFGDENSYRQPQNSVNVNAKLFR